MWRPLCLNTGQPYLLHRKTRRDAKLVMAAAANDLATVTLELGGKSPVIVDEDADVKKVAGVGTAQSSSMEGKPASARTTYSSRSSRRALWWRSFKPG